MQNYKTIIFGNLVQKTALSIGGSGINSDSNVTFRNGEGRLTIPATGIAGSFVETIMRIFPDCGTKNAEQFWKKITGKKRDNSVQEYYKSIFSFHNSHPVKNTNLEWRQGVGIDSDTGTASEHALFDYEVIPPGTIWSFLLEIDLFHAGMKAEQAALLALDEWKKGYGWLGRNAARGCGWIELRDIEIYRLPLTADWIKFFPDSEKNENELLSELKLKGKDCKCNFNEEVKIAQEQMKELINNNWHYLKLKCCFSVGKNDEYGLDTLQSGGHNALLDFYDENAENDILKKFVMPPTVSQNQNLKAKMQNAIEPDSFFPITSKQGEGVIPFLPGSSLRGSCRSVASKIERVKEDDKGENSWGVIDPNDILDIKKRVSKLMKEKPELTRKNAYQSATNTRFNIEDLFGIGELAGKILFKDAYVTNNNFKMLVQEQHAEDEFCCGVFESSKFDSMLMLKGDFEFEIVIEANKKDELTKLLKTLKPVLKMAQHGYVPLGGGKLKGSGFLPVIFKDIKLRRPGRDELSVTEEELWNYE